MPCRVERIEPPGRTRVEKAQPVGAGVLQRLGDVGTARPLALVAEDNEAAHAAVRRSADVRRSVERPR